MLSSQNLCDSVEQFVVCKDGAKQLLLGLDGMWHAKRGHVARWGLQIRNLIHIGLLTWSRLLQVRMFDHVEQICAQPVDKPQIACSLRIIFRFCSRYGGVKLPIYFDEG
jgi:hypothetical protein